MIGAAILSVRDVKLCAAVLGVGLVLQVIALTVIGIGVLLAKTRTSLTREALNLFHVTIPVAAQQVGTLR